MKGILQCKTIGNFKFFPNNDSASTHFAFVDFEPALVDVHDVVERSEDAREEPHLSPRIKTSICGTITAIDE